MPDPNQTNPNQPTSPAAPVGAPAPSVFPQSDLSPLPPDFSASTTTTTTTVSKEPMVGSGSAAPVNTPSPIISSFPKKKFGGGRIIATILGILLLVGGVGAGLILTQQQQLFKQKAAGCSCPDGTGVSCTGCQTGNVVGDQIYCSNCSSSGGPTICASGYGPQAGGGANGCVPNSGGNGGPGREPCPTGTHVSWANSSLTCTPPVPLGDWDRGTGNCCKYVHNEDFCRPYNAEIEVGSCVPDCDANAWGACSTSCGGGTQTNACGTTQACNVQSCSTPIPTPTPTPGPTAVCQNVKAYSATWTLLTSADLSALTSGTAINFCVTGSASSGTFDMAKFTINGVVQAETTTVRPSSTDFCQSYTIPAGVTTFNVTAQIHHVTQGWK